MRRYFFGKRLFGSSDIFFRPEIANSESCLFKVDVSFGEIVIHRVLLPNKFEQFDFDTPVQKADSPSAIGQRLEPDFETVLCRILQSLDSQRILVDKNGFLVGENIDCLFGHISQVIVIGLKE